jgi:ferredoxin
LKKTVVLNFKESSWDKPIVYRLIKDYDLVFNILKAHVSPGEEALLVLEITGKEDNYNKGIQYLKNQGISVRPIEKDVVRIEEKCLQCGVCTSMCPTKALDINRETMEVTFDAIKCIGCEACVKICPPRAMQVNLHD